MEPEKDFALNCPIPISDYPTILLAHGGGGRLMHQLIEKMFVEIFKNPILATRHDSAALDIRGLKLAFTTDSYVVKPLFFPGGDIGSLAVNGTVNDLAMAGARPLYLSAGFIIEEGLPTETLWRVVQSMRDAADFAGIQLVTGDTKVVDHGKGDDLFINTAGIGIVEHKQTISPASIKLGDVLIINGDVGRHGMAIMAEREGLAFESSIVSDCAPLWDPVRRLLNAGIQIHCLRDLTRGGLASVLVEIAESACIHIDIDESVIQVPESVRGACEILGIDPLYVANEGRFIAFVPGIDAEKALDILCSDRLPSGAGIIGQVTGGHPGFVIMKSAIGASRIVDMLSGEQLPRIC